MRLICFLSLLSILGGWSAAGVVQAPRATVLRPSIDLGVVGVGTDPIAAFPIRNDGDGVLELVIERLPRGLRLDGIDRSIGPSASGSVRVALETFRTGPEKEWRVVLTTNQADHATIELVVKADVREVLAMDPPAARFSFVQFGPEGGTSHVLASLDGRDIEVSGVESPFAYIRATWQEVSAQDRRTDVQGRQWRVNLTIAKDAPVGPIAGHVLVHTTHPLQPTAYLTVTGFVRPLFAVTPPAVNLGTVTTVSEERPLLTLVVRNFGAEALDIDRIESDIAGLTTTLVVVDPGHVWRVQLRATKAAAGSLAGTLRIFTRSPDVPMLTVPVEGSRAGNPER